MKLCSQYSWYGLELLEGEEYATGDSWRKLVKMEGRSLLLLQRGAWCGVRQDVYELEGLVEVEDWKNLLS
ncbi:MAG: hypothetical protein HQL73_05600 [Magnetococcales bacterium]|nr:hypothetical protein [Magnetococcales bacterium]